MAKVAFHTLGCKVNQYETEGMMAQFEARGYDIVSFSEQADVYLVNTCTVTNMADKKSRQMLSKAKKTNPDGFVAAVGCYVQASEEALSELEHVDMLIGNTDKNRIVDVVESYMEKHVIPEVVDLKHYKTYDDMWLSIEQGHTRVHIKIQDGCDQFCSYCIIPYARGRVRSRDQHSILEEVTKLVSSGYKEVVLSGIHLASYETSDDYVLIDLLEELGRVEGLLRVRLGSLEPTLITEEFAERLSQVSNICDHFHLSMQSGSDQTLKEMNRKYKTLDYKNAVDLLRVHFPNSAITTDLIVGFPGESDLHFAETKAFIKSIGFSDVHVFKYSMRDGTKAAKMDDQVDGTIKNLRSSEAIAIVEEMKNDFYSNFMNKTLDVLIEDEVIIKDEAYYIGHTNNYLKVYMKKKGLEHLNNIVALEISEKFADGLLGF